MTNVVEVRFDVDPGARGAAELRQMRGRIDEYDGASSRARNASRGLSDDTGLLGKGFGAAALGATGAALAVGACGLKTIEVGAQAQDSARVLQASAKLAGEAYKEATADAERFADATGAAQSIADRSYSSILRFAKGADQTSRVDEFTRAFTDLAAANGVRAGELGDVARQFNALSDEGVEKLLGKNPSAFYDDFAKSVGKTAGNLTEVEKRTAIFNETIKQGALFSGEAEKRLESASGQLDRFKANLQNGIENVGKNLLERSAVGDLIKFINSGGNFDYLDRNAEAATRRAQDQARAQVDAKLKELNARPGTASNAPGLDALALGFDTSKLTDEQKKAREEYMRARDASLKAEAQRRAEEAAREQQQQKEAVARLRDTRKEVEDFFREVTGRANADNPFVRVFQEGESSIERLRKQFGLLGDTAVAQFARIEGTAREQQTAILRIEGVMRAFDLQSEASRLKQGIVGLSAEDERGLGVFEKRFAGLQNIPALLRQAEAFERGFNPLNEFQQQREKRGDYERILALRSVGNDPLSRAANGKIDDFILEQTANLGVGARFSPDAFTRQLAAQRAAALRGRAGRFEQELIEEQQRAAAGRFGTDAAREKLSVLRGFGGLDNDTVRKQFLAVTGALDPRELTGDLRKGRIESLEREAQKELDREREAKAAVDAAAKQRAEMVALLKTLAEKAKSGDAGTLKLLIDNRSEAFVDDSQLGAPTR